MSKERDGSNDLEGPITKSLISRGELNHEVNSTIESNKKERVILEFAEEKPLIYKRAETVYEDKDSLSTLKDNDLDWIKLLKRCNINDEKVKEIEDEWIKLITQITKLSRFF